MNENFLGGRVVVKVGDITQEKTDAIVNAANSTLLGGGGVDGAIHRAGGGRILEECRIIRAEKYPQGLPTGEAVITSGGNLAAKFVIHTVGPIYGMNGGGDAHLLAECYKNCLRIASENKLPTISFPSISTGAFGYPKHEAAAVAARAVESFLANNETLEKICLVFFSAAAAQKFIKHQKFS
ncbi:MAG: O-acetyl-ADP-ribose deacetylase [Pyrinomonadaceae bacterium]|nr:O-acetyl-ADP-ribose deacetylase [Pyrinomonadaceae bacterium]